MRILERPVATAGLGVACAIALLFVLSGPYLANNSNVPSATPANTPDLSRQDSLTTMVSSVTSSATSSGPYFSKTNATQTVTSAMTTTVATTVSSKAVGLNSGSSGSLFAFNSVDLASSGHSSAEFFTLAMLAIFSLVFALGSMYFVKRRSADNAPEIETRPS